MNLGIGLYLLVVSNSATASICFLLGVALLFAGRGLAVMKHAGRVFMLNVLAIVFLMAFEQVYGVVGRVSESMDRGTGLTGRTEIWRVILEKNTTTGWGRIPRLLGDQRRRVGFPGTPHQSIDHRT